MKRTRYKNITMTIGLICLMLVAVMIIALATTLVKGNAIYAKTVGIFIIAAFSCLSLNSATTILDRPKEKVPSFYRKMVLGIIIATGVVVVFWLIVLFATDPGLFVRYCTGKKFRFEGSNALYETADLALKDATAARDKVASQLLITQIAVCLTIVVAYFNLIVTRRFIFKNRMIPIQVALYFGAFLFYAWLLLFFCSAHVIVETKAQYYDVVLEPTGSMSVLVNALGFTIAFSGLAIYLIAKISSIWSIRRFKNEGLYDEKAVVNSDNSKTKVENKPEEIKPNNDTNDVKARIEKLKELHDQGLISDEEFEAKKKDIIDSI
ncbi:MAG: SHOCT domain-containing protein [Acholeplasmatales bacterium]|nr:SHOCT domain-containing protein [Acholeplasmatales bacterium]